MVLRTDVVLTPEAYIELLNASSLGERRPVDDPAIIAAMLRHANLLVTAWQDDLLVGASRCLTDFRFVTYCADLCVRASFQRLGVGKALLRRTMQEAPCRIVLLSAPKAVDYYPHIGFTRHPSAWTILPGELG